MPRTMRLYHRTDAASARAVLASGRFVTRENTLECYVSDRWDEAAEAAGYGKVVVEVVVAGRLAELEDEFPDGERHFRIPLAHPELRIVGAFTVGPDGQRIAFTAD